MALSTGDLAARSNTSASKVNVAGSTITTVGVNKGHWRVWYDLGDTNAYVAYDSQHRREQSVRVGPVENVWIENTGDEELHWEIRY